MQVFSSSGWHLHTIFVQYDMYTIFAYIGSIFLQYFCNICSIFAQYLCNICTIFEQHLYSKYTIFSRWLYNVSTKFDIYIQILNNVFEIFEITFYTILLQYTHIIFVHYLHNYCSIFEQNMNNIQQYLCNILYNICIIYVHYLHINLKSFVQYSKDMIAQYL